MGVDKILITEVAGSMRDVELFLNVNDLGQYLIQLKDKRNDAGWGCSITEVILRLPSDHPFNAVESARREPLNKGKVISRIWQDPNNAFGVEK